MKPIEIPVRYENADLKDIDKGIQDKVVAMRESRKGLYIHGECGTGKTHIAYAIKKYMKSNDIHCRVYNSTELLRELKKDFDDQYSNVFDDIQEYRGLIIIDDLGAEKITEWVAETFYLIINQRYNDMKPMIITSNLSLNELAKRIGDRIPSRISDMSDVVGLTGGDRRIK